MLELGTESGLCFIGYFTQPDRVSTVAYLGRIYDDGGKVIGLSLTRSLSLWRGIMFYNGLAFVYFQHIILVERYQPMPKYMDHVTTALK